MQHSTLEKVQVQLIAFMTHIFIGLVQSITHTLAHPPQNPILMTKTSNFTNER